MSNADGKILKNGMKMLDKNLNTALNLAKTDDGFIRADWVAPSNVRTLITTRLGGVSVGAYQGLNVGTHVGDCLEHVLRNREIVQSQVPVPVAYLEQTHSVTVVNALLAIQQKCYADASVDSSGQVACAVMTADCLPVLFCNYAGTVVAAAHAGWRGLVNGILSNTVEAMSVSPMEIIAWFGPAIGADAFEVGEDVRDAFCRKHNEAESAFCAIGNGKYLADVYQLAKQDLYRIGVTQIYGGGHCTVLERDAFFSYRRDGQTGRMVSMVWLENKHRKS